MVLFEGNHQSIYGRFERFQQIDKFQLYDPNGMTPSGRNSHFKSPFEAFIYYKNVLADLKVRLNRRSNAIGLTDFPILHCHKFIDSLGVQFSYDFNTVEINQPWG